MESPFSCDPIAIAICIQIYIFLNSGYLRKLLKPNEFIAYMLQIKACNYWVQKIEIFLRFA